MYLNLRQLANAAISKLKFFKFSGGKTGYIMALNTNKLLFNFV